MTRRRIVTKTSQHSTRYHLGSVFVNATRRHAPVRRFNYDSDSLRLQYLLDNVGDLRS